MEQESRSVYTCPTCGATNLPYNMLCDACQYATRPRQAWDGHAMLYSYTADRYYASLDAADDWLEDGQTLADLRLVICEPNMARELSSDYWEGELEMDDRLPPALEDAIDAVNAVIAALPPLSWSPGRYAVDLSNVAGVAADA